MCRAYWNIPLNETVSDNRCGYESCQFSHNIEEFLKDKPKDLASSCYNYETNGYCQYGIICRYVLKAKSVVQTQLDCEFAYNCHI